MRLYANTSRHFIEDTVQNQISEKLKQAFFNYVGHYPSPTEVASWRNSLPAVSNAFQHAELLDQGIILEYYLPQNNSRLDCMIMGRDSSQKDNAVIIELKQWEKCEQASGENEVLTWLGGGKKEKLHPSIQVGRYKMYLEDTSSAFYEGTNPVVLNACTYLHNYHHEVDDPLLSEKFKHALENCPAFTADDLRKLEEYLTPKLKLGYGNDVLKRVDESKYRPSKKLMEYVRAVIVQGREQGKKEFVLLDEQQQVYDRVITCVKEGFHNRKKAVIVAKGGPGTGKSVIAINLMADLLGQDYNVHYATGSSAFTETLKERIGPRSTPQFKYFNSYMGAKENEIDVLIADEAHRIRKKSASRFTRRDLRTDTPQIDELLKVAKVCVFFIDDLQVVRPNEVGSFEYIKEHALKANCEFFDYELETQFRCGGSEAFVNWVNNTLGVRDTANTFWLGHEGFEFKIFESPELLEKAIREKVQEAHTGRLTAGYCWKWSDPNPFDGTLQNDVVIGEYRRPWNAKPRANRLAPGIPISTLWADDPNGINQIGCIYTAQGFEFDYVGVIFGNDLVYDPDKKEWKGQPENSEDGIVRRSRDLFLANVKNTYRVLLSRGMKGCYVYFVDKETEKFFRSRIKSDPKEIQALN